MISQTVLKKKINSLGEQVALVLVKPENYKNASIEIVRRLTNKKIPGVYVTVNKPYNVLNDNFQKNRVRTDLILYIDAITDEPSYNMRKQENCYFLGSPDHLSDISIAISEAVNSIQHDKKFLFIDSISTFLVYNDAQLIIKFIHFLIGKIREWGIYGVLLSLQKRGEAGIISEISQFCDAIIEV